MPDGTERFAPYLAGVLVARHGFRRGTFPEAEALAASCDIVLTKADGMVVEILGIVDAEANPSRRFGLDRDGVVAIAKACRERHAGKINGTTMPCTIEIIEVRGTVSAEDLERLKPLRARVGTIVLAHAVDVSAQTDTVNSWSWLSARRRKIERLLREPRTEARLSVRPPAAVPAGTPIPFLGFALLAVLAAVFAAELLYPATPATGLLTPSVPTLLAFGGVARGLVLSGDWYRLLTAAFLHANVLHLALNGVALVMAGLVLEPLLGRSWTLALFFLGALGGSALSIALNPPALVSVGASGAIVAMLAAAFMVSFRLPEGLERTRAQVQLLRILVPALLPIAVRGSDRIDFAAHLGGAVVGFASAGAILATWPREAVRPKLTALATGVAVLALAAFGWSGNQARRAYPAYTLMGLLIPADELPKEPEGMVVQASSLVATYPRDPRARAFSAMARLRANDAKGAEAELRRALEEKRILEIAFNRELEVSLRSMLARVLVQQHRAGEARLELQPVCDAGPGKGVPESIRDLKLCP